MGNYLLKGASIVSMDESLGELQSGDILVSGGHIEAVGASLHSGTAEVIDCSGKIAVPGFVNAHMHTWQTGLRSVAGNWTLPQYLHNMHAGLATCFTPDDLHIGTLAGALNQINCGTTTLVDWCHNNPSPAHTDRAIDGLEQAGIRALFLHGSPKPDPKPGQRPFWETNHPREEIARLRSSRFANRNSLLSLGMAILGPHYSVYEVAKHDIALALEYGLIASMHCAGTVPKVPDGWERLRAEGLLGPHINIVHGNNLSDSQLKWMTEIGVTFSSTPEGEMTQGHGFPITGRLIKAGGIPSLGVDLESIFSGEMYSVARAALGLQRALDNHESMLRTQALPSTSTISCAEALRWITIGGAKMVNMEHRIGSITPGKEADIVLIDANAINMRPLHDLATAVVMQTTLSNIESVMIGGEFKKRNGVLCYRHLDETLRALDESGKAILNRFREKCATAGHVH
jgi:cytosine/adenosine deaminase-related metal-dependent hydrolase